MNIGIFHYYIHYILRAFLVKVVEILRGKGEPVELTKQMSISPRPVVLDLDDYSSSSYFFPLFGYEADAAN